MSDSPDSIRTSTATPSFLSPFRYDQVGLAVFLGGWALAGFTSIVNRTQGVAPTLFERNGGTVALWLGLPIFAFGLLGRRFWWQAELRDVKIQWLSKVNSALCWGVAALAACGVLSDMRVRCAAAAAAAGVASNQASGTASKPLPPEYRLVARHLALEMHRAPEEFRDDVSLAEILASGHAGVMRLRGVQSTDEELNYVAHQGQAALAEVVARLETISAMPKPASLGEFLASSFLAGMQSDPFSAAVAVASVADGQNQKSIAIRNQAEGLVAAHERADAARLTLLRIARKYAASQSPGGGRFTIDIDESWGGFGPHDWIRITNLGPPLEDCTICVALLDASGQHRMNVHFVRQWPANAGMYGRYEPGKNILGRQVGSTTIAGIQHAIVVIMSPNFTTDFMTYDYVGAERDRDVAERCGRLSFSGRYQPFEKGTLWNTQRGCEFTLKEGVALPKCEAIVTFKKGARTCDCRWPIDAWSVGETKQFETQDGQLTFDPDVIDLTLSFPHTAYEHRVSLTVGK